MNNSRTYNSAKNAILNLLARFIAMLCGFVIRTVFLRYLGDQYTGVSSLFTDILNILSFTELGIGTAVSFSLYKPIAENDHYRIAQLMRLYKYVYFTISGAVLILGIVFIPFLRFFVSDVPDIKENLVYIYFLHVLKTSFSYLLIHKSTFIIAKQKKYVVTGIECIVAIAKTGLEVLLLIATKSYVLYLWLEIACVLFTNLLISSYAKKESIEIDTAVTIDKSDFRSLFKNLRDIVIYKFSGIVLNSTDSLIISRFVNVGSVTLLSNYNIVFNTVNSLIYQVISAMTASVGNLAISKSQDNQKRVFYTINFLSFVFTLIECTGLWLCINPFISILWGSRYTLDMPMVALLCINSFFINMHLSIDMFRTANGVFHKGRLRPLATAVINLIVSLVAVQYMGLFGVLLGTVVSRASTQAWYDPKLVFNDIFNCSVKEYYIKYFFYFVALCCCCISGSFFKMLLPQNAVLSFVICFFYSILICSAVIVLFYRKTDEFNSILTYIGAILKKIRS